ncbi:flagellar biosynthesis protein FlgL [Croceicoccus gelatinilyticus]|uniref:flagellin N-terminal helical domain-containing protein n=1 Tax=Croceicoccus gelatinilyticus TaxID=2835536 RepID=UPI001BCD40BB|nr:flagellar biosynthesis protein FlgL [Croceicoccus gelatinilyticus]MBS7671322.1 flagellar biosynthesis protein FlgL [Croceicoccus gelatinilyticus]
MTGISTTAFYERSRIDMTKLRVEMEKYQGQLASGERLERSSDDPVAASRLRTLARDGKLAEVDIAKKDRAVTDLQLADEAVRSIGDLAIKLRELSVQAANDALSDVQRKAIGLEVDAIHTQLVSLANSKDIGGHALFGGEVTGDAYQVGGGGYATYIGTAVSGEIDLGGGQAVTRSITGPEIFNVTVGGTPTDLLTVAKDLAIALGGGSADPAQSARDALGGITAAIDNVSTNQTVLGSRLVWLDFVADRSTNLGELRAAEENATGGADIGETMTRLQEAMVVLQGSQAAFTKLSSLSLFDQLR